MNDRILMVIGSIVTMSQNINSNSINNRSFYPHKKNILKVYVTQLGVSIRADQIVNQ